MSNYMYAIDRSDEYLAHYGVKGMRWGVRKLARALTRATAAGDSRKVARLRAKIERKAAKYEKMSNSGKKYAKRAALLGAGAAAAGGLAAAGTQGVGKALRQGGHTVANMYAGGANAVGGALSGVGNALARTRLAPGLRNAGIAIASAGRNVRNSAQNARNISAGMTKAGNAVSRWGKSTAFTMDNAKSKQLMDTAMALQKGGAAKYAAGNYRSATRRLTASNRYAKASEAAKTNVTNNTLARAGAGLVGAGLAGAAGYNAYRAATTKRAGETARQYRSLLKSNSGGSRKRKRRG